MGEIVSHAPDLWLGAAPEKMPRLYRRLSGGLAAHPKLHLATVSLHDILAPDDRVVTITSAVGIKALLHRTPVLLCERADFRHICTSARDPQTLRARLPAPAQARTKTGRCAVEASASKP